VLSALQVKSASFRSAVAAASKKIFHPYDDITQRCSRLIFLPTNSTTIEFVVQFAGEVGVVPVGSGGGKQEDAPRRQGPNPEPRTPEA